MSVLMSSANGPSRTVRLASGGHSGGDCRRILPPRARLRDGRHLGLRSAEHLNPPQNRASAHGDVQDVAALNRPPHHQPPVWPRVQPGPDTGRREMGRRADERARPILLRDMATRRSVRRLARWPCGLRTTREPVRWFHRSGRQAEGYRSPRNSASVRGPCDIGGGGNGLGKGSEGAAQDAFPHGA